MIVLGWHGGMSREYEDMPSGWSTHDGAAVLMVDGEIVAAMEEERLNRIKHSNFFPVESIRFCLEHAGINLSDVDYVAMNFVERSRDIFPCDAGLPSINHFLEDTTRQSFSVRDSICTIFQNEFQTDVADKLFFCNHHIAHLWSAWGCSPYSSGLVVSFDGVGDNLSGMIGVGNEEGLRVLHKFGIEQSLGNLYSDLIRFLGYNRFDEYKVMGLAPHGDPTPFRSLFKKFYRLLPEGEYELTSRNERWGLINDAGILPNARRKGMPFTTMHKDFAASLQETLEKIAMYVLDHFRTQTQQHNLCLAGGVSHNCSLNGKLLYAGGFESVFVQPAAHDAGGALGAAFAATQKNAKSKLSGKFSHLFLGRDVPPKAEIESTLSRWGQFLNADWVEDIPKRAARLLADGCVLGWVQGRSEFGPRALGHRSILADPRPLKNKSRINSMVKRRESYRPFAPSILHEKLGNLLEMPNTDANLSFMTFVLNVKESVRDELGAVTHVDGTARVQSVSKSSDPVYWALISEFEKLTGVPVILNTSFNNNAEPIVDSVEDAIVCFLTTDIDYLVLGNYLVHKADVKNDNSAYFCLRPSLAHSRKLTRRSRPGAGSTNFEYSIETTTSLHFGAKWTEISHCMYLVLIAADGATTLAELLEGVDDCDNNARQELREELFELWMLRAVILQP